MSRTELVACVVQRLNAHLETLERLKVPGSVFIEIHRDATDVRKVEVVSRETWPVR